MANTQFRDKSALQRVFGSNSAARNFYSVMYLDILISLK